MISVFLSNRMQKGCCLRSRNLIIEAHTNKLLLLVMECFLWGSRKRFCLNLTEKEMLGVRQAILDVHMFQP